LTGSSKGKPHHIYFCPFAFFAVLRNIHRTGKTIAKFIAENIRLKIKFDFFQKWKTSF
jgi:hypothetical protein